MTGDERKRAFKAAAADKGDKLSAAAILSCGVTWEHLSRGISDEYQTPLSDEVKAKFAAYIGRSVADVFGQRSGRGVGPRLRGAGAASGGGGGRVDVGITPRR